MQIEINESERWFDKIEIKKFTSTPVTVEAVRFDGTPGGACGVFEAFDIPDAKFVPSDRYLAHGTITIPTMEGVMSVSAGDWIVKEPFPTEDRKFCPVKAEIFRQRYREASVQPKLGPGVYALVRNAATTVLELTKTFTPEQRLTSNGLLQRVEGLASDLLTLSDVPEPVHQLKPNPDPLKEIFDIAEGFANKHGGHARDLVDDINAAIRKYRTAEQEESSNAE